MTGYSERFVINDIPTTYSTMSFKNKKEEKAVSNFIEGKEIKSPRYRRKAVVIVATTLLALSMGVDPTSAAMVTTAADAGLPKEVDDILLKIQLVCLGLCVGVAGIMGMVAGFFRIVGLREESKKRFMDSIVGMVMVLTAPTVLLIIATIVRGLLAIMPGSIS